MSDFFILKPGLWLIRRMRFGVKLSVLAATLLVPLIAVLFALVSKDLDTVDIAQKERVGAQIVQQVGGVVRLVQLHRGQTILMLSGDLKTQSDLERTRQDLASAVTALDLALAPWGNTTDLQHWYALRTRIGALAGDVGGNNVADSFALHTELIDLLRRFVRDLGTDYELLFDPDPATYLLIEIIVNRIPLWTEHLSKLRGIAPVELDSFKASASDLQHMTSYAQNLEAFLADTSHAHNTLAKYGISNPVATKAEEDSRKFLVLTQQRLLHTATAGEVSAHFAAGTQAIEAVYALQASAGERIDENLGARIQSTKQSFWLASVASVVGIGLMLYFMLAFHTSFLWDLGQVLAFMHETASGNLRHRVDILGKDEISDMNSAMTLMVRNMSAMVADVRSNAALVRHAGDTLVNGNTALATRTEQQAANLEQTAATVNEVASALQTTSLAAQNSDYTAIKVRDAAEHGAQGMLQAVATIEAIAKSTTRMDEIVSVIDGLAFQTNILALNAAVEAARAGDSGRGFAVVASEVRSLAQRSAAASREIRNLIGASSTQVDLGVREIQSAEGSISKIVEGIREVAQMISGITASSVEQSNSLAEITAAVRQLDLITQQNATMVDESVNQAKALLARAVHLEQAADSYRLQQGTAEEAR